MYLLIDTSEHNTISLALFDEHDTCSKVVEGKNRTLLTHIDAFLREKHIEKHLLEGIAVVVGKGSFTSTRIAVTVSNTFSYALSIPVLPISKDEMIDLDALRARIAVYPKGQYVSATYSAAPSIGGILGVSTER